MPSRRPHRDLRVRGDPTYRARLDRGWEEIVEWASRTKQVALEEELSDAFVAYVASCFSRFRMTAPRPDRLPMVANKSA